MLKTKKQIPNCFANEFSMDDCIVSCPYWEECMEGSEEIEDECEEA